MKSAKFTSISRLVLPFESIWGIISKFRLLNCVSSLSLKRMINFFNGKTPNYDLYYYRLTKWNYSNSLTFTDDCVSYLSSIPSDKMYVHQITSAIDIKDLQWLSSCYYLRFCPVCLAQGYHSIFHQMSFFEGCPIHEERLKTKCPHCDMYIKYELLDAKPFACPSCNRNVWSRFIQKNGHLLEQLLHLSTNQISEFDNLFDWLVAIKTCPPIRQRFSVGPSGQVQDIPRISAREVYAVWHCIGIGSDVPRLAMPLQLAMPHHMRTFGAPMSGNDQLFCISYRLGRYSKILKSGSRWVNWKIQQCEDGSKQLGPIYHSICRHEFKMLNKKGINCQISGFAAGSFRFPKKCRGCNWAKAYALWRQYWTTRLADPENLWQDICANFEDVRQPQVIKWAGLWLFALQCLWELSQAKYLSEVQGVSADDSDNAIQGELSFTWILEESSPSGKPVFHFWTKKLNYTQIFACSERNVAE